MRGHIRLAAVLAHTVPGVTLELHGRAGDTLIVAGHRLDADLTPCQLRAALLAPRRAGVKHVADAVDEVVVGRGLDDLGAGVYRRSGDDGEERWLATYLPVDVLTEVFSACPIDLPDEAMEVNLHTDSELAAAAVRITVAHPAFACRLDEVALWALTGCAVEELLRGLGHEMSHR